MDNPQAMISANVKMKKVNRTLGGNKFLQRLLLIGVLADERIKITEKELSRRQVPV